MTFLDRYILRQFLINFVILFLLLFSFMCVIDLFLNLDKFMDAVNSSGSTKAGAAGTLSSLGRWWATLLLVVNFYTPKLFQFYSFLVGIISIGALGFTLVQFHRNRELTAFLAAGVSLHRVAMPLIVAILGLNLLQIVNREVALPYFAPLLLRGHSDIGQQAVDDFRVNLIPDGEHRVFYARAFAPSDQTLASPVIWEYDGAGKLRSFITANSAQWDGQAMGWHLTGGQATAIASPDANTAAAPTAINFVKSDLDPTGILMRRYMEFRQLLSLAQIDKLVRSPRMAGDPELIRLCYGRFSQILINVLTMLITLPYFMIREPKNLLTQSVLCAAVGLACQIGGAVGTTVGLPVIPPAASVFFIPLVILLPLAVFRLATVET